MDVTFIGTQGTLSHASSKNFSNVPQEFKIWVSGPSTAPMESIGKMFHEHITSNQSDEFKIELIQFSESNRHTLHNAALTWLEQQKNDGMKYENELKRLWIDQVIRRFDRTGNNRQVALAEYLREHTTLGKVVSCQSTQFHKDDSIQVHPAFWGLFLFSPRHAGDVKTYSIDQSEQAWLNYLQTQKLSNSGSQYQIYESVPRKFADKLSTPPGVYLHRSKAHGRDDFLVLVSGTQKRECMVLCTKGVGAYAPYVPKSTAGDFHTAFLDKWNAQTSMLPFAYSNRDNAGSWRTLGFCITTGNLGEGETEELTTDFSNFNQLFNFVKRLKSNSLASSSVFELLAKGFVEPFIAIELSPLRTELLRPEILEGIQSKAISYPAQIITCAPCETSLRLYKKKSDQDYDYDCLDLELTEWERCYTSVIIPNEDRERINQDAVLAGVELQKKLKEMQVKQLEQSELDILTEKLRRQMSLAYKMMLVMFASYTTFLKYEWATDTYTGSFSGRNFNSGPRDANQWGLLATPAKPGKAKICGEVDLIDLPETIAEAMFQALGLIIDVYRPFAEIHQKLHASLEEKDDDLQILWRKCLVTRMSTAIQFFFGVEAKAKLLNLAKQFSSGDLKTQSNQIGLAFQEYLLIRAKDMMQANPYESQKNQYFPGVLFELLN
jgi:hypothetical protein